MRLIDSTSRWYLRIEVESYGGFEGKAKKGRDYEVFKKSKSLVGG